MTHIISIDDLRGWEHEHEFAGSHSRESSKSLRFYFKDGYTAWRIYEHKKLVDEVISPVHAVEIYNNLR